MNIAYYDVRIFRYGSKYKVNYINRFASSELYVPDDDIREDDPVDGKLMNNLCRAKSNVLALGLCNPWEHFVTFTLDKKKYDRTNLDVWQRDFSQYIRNQRRLHGQEIQYLLIPELHKDGESWHMHGFMSGISWDSLDEFVPGKHPQRLCTGEYRWHKGIHEKFGFNSFAPVKNAEAAAKYALKYVTKSMAERKDALGAHLYYCSRGLKRPELVADGCSTAILSEVEFGNQFMSTGWLSKEEVDQLKGVLL